MNSSTATQWAASKLGKTVTRTAQEEDSPEARELAQRRRMESSADHLPLRANLERRKTGLRPIAPAASTANQRPGAINNRTNHQPNVVRNAMRPRVSQKTSQVKPTTSGARIPSDAIPASSISEGFEEEGEDDDEAEEQDDKSETKDSTNDIVTSNRPSTNAQKNWAALRKGQQIVKVRTAFNQIAEDQKMFGVDIKENDNTDDKVWHSRIYLKGHGKRWFIIMPDNQYRVGWDVFEALMLLFIAFYIPFRLAFVNELDETWMVVENMVTLSFVLSICINFVTAYYTPEGVLVFDCIKVAKNYAKGFFMIDLIATIPFDELSEGDDDEASSALLMGRLARLTRVLKFFRIARLFRLLKVGRLNELILKMESNFNIHQGVTKMMTICFMVLLVTHAVACTWFLIGSDFDPEDSYNCRSNVNVRCSWVQEQGLEHATNYRQYVASLYWSFSTLTTVGYGDISAVTSGEKLYAMIMMMLGVSWYAYIVGSMSTIMSSFENQNKRVRDKMMAVQGFIRENKLEPALARRVRQYFSHLYTSSGRWRMLHAYDASEVFRNMSTELRNEVILHVEGSLIERIPFFQNKTEEFICDALVALQPMVANAGDYIIREGMRADEMYFILKGRAAIVTNGIRRKALIEGSYFGEIGCIMGGLRRASVLAVTTCELSVLHKRNLAKLLTEFPDVADELRALANKRLSKGKTSAAESNRISVVEDSVVKEGTDDAVKENTAKDDHGQNEALEGNGASDSLLVHPIHNIIKGGTNDTGGEIAPARHKKQRELPAVRTRGRNADRNSIMRRFPDNESKPHQQVLLANHAKALELHLNISLQKAVATLEDEINSLREAVRETSGKNSSHTGAHLNLRDIDDEGSVADPKW